jgi:hypothetical protein
MFKVTASSDMVGEYIKYSVTLLSEIGIKETSYKMNNRARVDPDYVKVFLEIINQLEEASTEQS